MDPTLVKISKKHNYDLPAKFLVDDSRYTNSLVQYFLERYTKEGDKILDPFAGFGTTLYVAETFNRVPYGIELQKDRFEFIRSNITHKDNIFNGNSLHIGEMNLPPIDFCMTSPPFMTKNDDEYALSNYTTKGSYVDYLTDLTTIFQKIKKLLKKDGILIVEASNIKNDQITTLAWDIGIKLSNLFEFKGEVIIDWDGARTERGIYGSGYDHSYCLIFKKN